MPSLGNGSACCDRLSVLAGGKIPPSGTHRFCISDFPLEFISLALRSEDLAFRCAAARGGTEELAALLGLPALPVGLPARPVGLPARPVGLPALPVALPARPVGSPALPVGLPARPVGLPALPVGLPALPMGSPALPVGPPARPVGLPARPAGRCGREQTRQGQPGAQHRAQAGCGSGQSHCRGAALSPARLPLAAGYRGAGGSLRLGRTLTGFVRLRRQSKPRGPAAGNAPELRAREAASGGTFARGQPWCPFNS